MTDQKPKPRSLEMQVLDWLNKSRLGQKDLPGEILKREFAYKIWFYDIDGKRQPEWDIRRLFSRENGFKALTMAAPDAPKPEEPPKYLSPAGSPPHLYYPQNTQITRVDYRVWARDPKQRKLIPEGAKKSSCAQQFGFPAVGVEGCWGWSARKHGRLWLPEFDDYVFDDCDVYWIPDHDRNPKAVADILRASSAFARFMQQDRNAKFHVVWLPLLEGYEKVGLDDFLVHYSRKGKDTAAARRALDDLLEETPIWQDWELSDTGNSRRWVSMYGSQFRHIGKRGWHFYEGGCWREDVRIVRQETAKQMFEEMIEDAVGSGNSERAGQLRKQITAPRIKYVGELAKSDPVVAAEPALFDRWPLLLNAKNGTLELPATKDDKLKFRPHNPNDLLTKQVAVGYNATALCPVFLAALDFWTKKDKKLQRTLQQLIGLCLTGITREQVFIILYGPGGTGKSRLIEIMKYVLGSYAKALPSDTFLLRKHGEKEERKLAQLPGIRLALASETEETGVLDENLIKLLTGEDTATGRLLYAEAFDFMPEAKILLRTNNKPKIRGTSEAIWRRVIAIPFGQVIPEDQKDKMLPEKLKQEAEGIFAWMVEGYLHYAKNGMFIAPTIKEAIEQYRQEEDVIEGFFAASCDFGPNYSVGRETLYLRFSEWVRGRSHQQPSQHRKITRIRIFRPL